MTINDDLRKSKLEKPDSGLQLIRIERSEQIHKHGFSLENDAKYYSNGELVQAAAFCLKLAGFERFTFLQDLHIGWPVGWSEYFKNKIITKNRKEQLIVAGAFLMAENDRRKDNFWIEEINVIAKEIETLIEM